MSSVQFNPAYPHNLSSPAVASTPGAAREEAPSSPQSVYKPNSMQGPSCFLPDGVQDISEITFINPKEQQKTDGKLLGGAPPVVTSADIEAGCKGLKILRGFIALPMLILIFLGIFSVVGPILGFAVPIIIITILAALSLYISHKNKKALEELERRRQYV